MKRIIFIVFILLINLGYAYTQNGSPLDSLKRNLSLERKDSAQIYLMNRIASNYRFEIPDSLFVYANQALKLSKSTGNVQGEVGALLNIIIGLRNINNDSKAFQIALSAIKLAEKHNLVEDKGLLLLQIGDFYRQSLEFDQAFERFREAKVLFDSLRSYYFSVTATIFIAEIHELQGQLDSALYYGHNALNQAQKYELRRIDRINNFLGKIYIHDSQYDLARKYLSEEVSETNNTIYERFYQRANLYQHLSKPDSALIYGKQALEMGKIQHSFSHISQSSQLLSEAFQSSNKDSSIYFLKIALSYKDSILDMGKLSALEGFSEYDEQERKSLIESEKQAYIQKIRWGIMFFGLLALLCIALLMYRNYHREKLARKTIFKKNTELHSMIDTLKSTQAQLIQSEKMASLGELTAGIAHEIQNPLNFVNNFSEVSRELIDEMKEEFKKGDTEEGFAIADDLKNNLEKINDHGQRASSIVKGMLEHSRTSTGQKEPTDINALCDEYLKLAYHGFRAKDKSFNATIETHFDPTLPKVKVIPQDIGRVILNLINNAFYAVNKRSKDIERAASPSGAGDKGGQVQENMYAPTVSITTSLTTNSQQPTANSQLLIAIKDNGSGIPAQIKDKIFQPFFTTKPTGQGTGLGLSLAYDIVKAHGGELTLESKEGVGTEFTIRIPIG
jgi:signal transduction histidine kinase